MLKAIQSGISLAIYAFAVQSTLRNFCQHNNLLRKLVTMKKSSLFYLFTAALAMGFYQTPVQAISIGFQPITQTIATGNSFSVDVVISGLTSASEIVSAFDLDITYDPGILATTGIIFSKLLGDPTMYEADNGSVITAGRIDFWGLSFLSDADLLFVQTDSFSLATLTFQALGVGATDLLFDSLTFPGIDVKGLLANPLALDVSTGNVTVTDPSIPSTPVPEPSTVWMCLLGFGVIARRMSQA
jgi:hypothetical protein